MKGTSKTIIAAFVLIGLFIGTYVGAQSIMTIPNREVTQRVYTHSQSSLFSNSSVAGGNWDKQNLFLSPAAGSTNVSRDTEIGIGEPRQVKIENITLTPHMPIAEFTQEKQPPASAHLTIRPEGLLEPNMTYNVSAVVAGQPSWWIFTTGSEPTELSYETLTVMQPGTTLNALVAAVLVTLAAAGCMVLYLRLNRRRKHSS